MAVVPDVTGGLVAELARLRSLIRRCWLRATRSWPCTEQLAILQAVFTRAVAAFDAGGTWEADGARSAAAWVATRCRLPTPVSRRRVRLGRALRHMADVEAAWLAGDIGEAQVSLLGRGPRPATPRLRTRRGDAGGRGEALRYRHFVPGAGLLVPAGRPRRRRGRPRPAHARRLHLSQSFDGLWFADGIFDPVGGAIFDKALRGIEDELFEPDWAEAKARVGEGVTVSDLARTPAQRRADAVVEMARRAGAVPGGPDARAAVHRAGGLRDLRRAHLRAGRRHRLSPGSWCPGWTRRGWSGWCSTAPTG